MAKGCSTRQLDYRNLSADPNWPEIRLLEVRPAKSIHDVFSARIVNLPLTPDLDFIGVSALYGDTDHTEPVIINGRRVSVPANLGQALRHSRAVFWPAQTDPNPGPAAEPRRTMTAEGSGTRGTEQTTRKKPHWLHQFLRSLGLPPSDSADRPRSSAHQGAPTTLRIWIDAFCVNERDARERKEQHALMDMAYRHARAVVGWLGPRDDTSDLAVQIIRDVDRAMPEGFGSREHRRLRPECYAPRHVWVSEIEHLWRLPEGVTDLRRCDNWVAMSRFLSRQYFQRDWILNEIAMASFPTFLVGGEILSWSEVLRWNRSNEELSDTGAAQFPEEYRKEIGSFLPLGTVYTMLKAFESSRDSRTSESSSGSTFTKSLSNYSQ